MVAASALGVLALAAGGMSVRGMLRSPEAAPVVTGKIVGTAVLPPPVATPAPTAVALADPAPPTDRVQLTVLSEPAGARVVELPSGKTLGTTPLSAAVPRTTVPSRLRLEHAGRRATEVEVVPDVELEVHVAMPRAGRPATPAAGTLARKPKHPDPFKL
jgi:hypothetical protein